MTSRLGTGKSLRFFFYIVPKSKSVSLTTFRYICNSKNQQCRGPRESGLSVSGTVGVLTSQTVRDYRDLNLVERGYYSANDDMLLGEVDCSLRDRKGN